MALGDGADQADVKPDGAGLRRLNSASGEERRWTTRSHQGGKSTRLENTI